MPETAIVRLLLGAIDCGVVKDNWFVIPTERYEPVLFRISQYAPVVVGTDAGSMIALNPLLVILKYIPNVVESGEIDVVVIVEYAIPIPRDCTTSLVIVFSATACVCVLSVRTGLT